jgi:hypothetical protein
VDGVDGVDDLVCAAPLTNESLTSSYLSIISPYRRRDSPRRQISPAHTPKRWTKPPNKTARHCRCPKTPPTAP